MNPQGSARLVREGKVCLYGSHSGVLGALDKQRWATADNGEGASNHSGTAASKHQPTPSFLRTREILWKVHEEPLHTASSTVQTLTKKCWLEMETSTREGFQSRERTIHLRKSAPSLRSQLGVSPHV